MEKSKVRMKDIAEKMNISTVTVSKALSGKYGVGDKLRQEIKEMAQSMDYSMNIAAKSMKTGFSYNIGVIIPKYFFHKSNNFYLEFFRCLLDNLNYFGYYGILQVMTIEEIENGVMPRFVNEKNVDGIIFLGQIKKQYIKNVMQLKIPIVLSDFHYDDLGIPCIVSDNILSGYEISKYLYEMGHRDIGFVGDINATSSINERFSGFKKFIDEKSLVLRHECILVDRDKNNNIFDVYNLPSKLPTAFICNSDGVGYIFINYLKSQKIRVPKECSIASFDNTIFSDISSPSITAIETNIEEMSKTTVELIINIIKGELENDSDKNLLTYIKGVLIEKNSVKRIKIS